MSFDLVSATQSLFTANDRTNRLCETERETGRGRVANCTTTASEWTTALPRGETSILPTESATKRLKQTNMRGQMWSWDMKWMDVTIDLSDGRWAEKEER